MDAAGTLYLFYPKMYNYNFKVYSKIQNMDEKDG